MSIYIQKVIKTARDFPALDDLEVTDIASVRTEREKVKPVNVCNNYVRVFDHFDENGKPLFRWENLGGI